LDIPYSPELTILPTDQGIASGSYRIDEGTLQYNNGELYPNQEAYDMQVLAIVPNSTLGLTGDQITQQEATFAQRVEEIKTTLLQTPDATFEDASEVANGRIGLTEIKQAIPAFNGANT
jgi:hypothetical protein